MLFLGLSYLEKLPVGKIWGIGANTSEFLAKFGIKTALEFVRKDELFIKTSRNYLPQIFLVHQLFPA